MTPRKWHLFCGISLATVSINRAIEIVSRIEAFLVGEAPGGVQFASVHAFIEEPVDAFMGKLAWPDHPVIEKISKLIWTKGLVLHRLGRKATMADFFQKANQVLPAGDVALVTTSDVVGDSTIGAMKDIPLEGRLVCVGPHNAPPRAWILRVPILLSGCSWAPDEAHAAEKIEGVAKAAGLEVLPFVTGVTVSLLVGTYMQEQKRAEELLDCLEHNLGNPLISDIHLFIEDPVAQWEAWLEEGLEDETPYPALKKLDAFRTHPKVTMVEIGRRPFYREYFEYANKAFRKGRIVVISNSDIVFDYTLARLGEHNLENVFVCLSRDGGRYGHNPNLSQDSWIFQAPVRETLLECEWPLGVNSGDHRVAHVAEGAGYCMINPCLSVFAFHHHRSQVRAWQTLPPLEGPRAGVAPSGLEALASGKGREKIG